MVNFFTPSFSKHQSGIQPLFSSLLAFPSPETASRPFPHVTFPFLPAQASGTLRMTKLIRPNLHRWHINSALPVLTCDKTRVVVSGTNQWNVPQLDNASDRRDSREVRHDSTQVIVRLFVYFLELFIWWEWDRANQLIQQTLPRIYNYSPKMIRYEPYSLM